MKSKRSKACDIPQRVKDRVWERDRHRCIICHSPIAMPNAHVVARSDGGLGIEENIVTLCTMFADEKHHYYYDFGTRAQREEIGKQIEEYLKGIYPNWDKEKLIYRR